MLTPEAAKKLGLSTSKFLKLAKELGVKPTRIPNRQQRFDWGEMDVGIIQQVVFADGQAFQKREKVKEFYRGLNNGTKSTG